MIRSKTLLYKILLRSASKRMMMEIKRATENARLEVTLLNKQNALEKNLLKVVAEESSKAGDRFIDHSLKIGDFERKLWMIKYGVTGAMSAVIGMGGYVLAAEKFDFDTEIGPYIYQFKKVKKQN